MKITATLKPATVNWDKDFVSNFEDQEEMIDFIKDNFVENFLDYGEPEIDTISFDGKAVWRSNGKTD